MITANRNEQFSDVFIFYDLNGYPIESYTATYIITDAITDVTVSSGTMVESFINDGMYIMTDSISESGSYVCYANCSAITINRDIRILPENIYDLVKSRRNHNQSYEDVLRPDYGSPNASQTFRKVPTGGTDYIIHRIKEDFDSDWSSPTASGNAYPYYIGNIPYKVEGAL